MEANAQARYEALRSDREQFLDVARTCAKLTLPYLLTDEGHANGERLTTPWRSMFTRLRTGPYGSANSR